MAFNDGTKGALYSPGVWGAVSASTDFTHDGKTYICRAILSNGDGTITVTMEDGTTGKSKQIVKGLNVFRCKQVTNLDGLTLEWQA